MTTVSDTAGMRVVDVITTYLELRHAGALRPARLDDADITVVEAMQPTVAFYRFLYAAVGSTYAWTDRLAWSDAELHDYLQRPGVTILVVYVRGVPAGYVELLREADEPGTEIAYFGIMPEFQGRGLGKYLLTVGAERAFDGGAERVWLHTCSLDGPYALANYQARGFMPYKTIAHQRQIAQ
ncbi:MAG TPA: GNAT family N-acetyltransferase, partial [Roseiflexaceae bacterium]|nr:GNAT family N-acetyltransferase [Roseiflexaceae bacterium]